MRRRALRSRWCRGRARHTPRPSPRARSPSAATRAEPSMCTSRCRSGRSVTRAPSGRCRAGWCSVPPRATTASRSASRTTWCRVPARWLARDYPSPRRARRSMSTTARARSGERPISTPGGCAAPIAASRPGSGRSACSPSTIPSTVRSWYSRQAPSGARRISRPPCMTCWWTSTETASRTTTSRPQIRVSWVAEASADRWRSWFSTSRPAFAPRMRSPPSHRPMAAPC